MYPDFLVIGAQKAGTTWLYENLRKHPGIWMPKEKELHYFDEKARLPAPLGSKLFGGREADRRWRRQAARQLRGYREGFSAEDLAWDLRYFLRPADDAWYASLFEPGRGKVTGETTPTYSMLGKEEVARVYGMMPRARILFMMRNPVERTWSQAIMGLAGRRYPEEVSDEELRWHLGRRRSQRLSNYLRTLKNWSNFFPEEQIFVGFLEDVHFYPDRLLRGVHRFLGVEEIPVDPGATRRKVYAGNAETMPAYLAAELANLHRRKLERLARRFGGYADFWRYCAGRLVEDPPPDETIPYPFWESSLWREWTGAEGGSGGEPSDPRRRDFFQSGVLSSVLARANGKN